MHKYAHGHQVFYLKSVVNFPGSLKLSFGQVFQH